MRRMKTIVLIMICFSGWYTVNGQVAINEISSDGRIEIINIGSDTVDLTDYWLCNRPQYERIGEIGLECGDRVLAGGDSVVVQVSTLSISAAGDEMGLYSTNAGGFSDTSALVDYVIWGTIDGSTRESVAVVANIRTAADIATAFSDSTSLQYDGAGDAAADYSAGAMSLCSGEMMVMDTCTVAGMTIAITLPDTTTSATVCIDTDAPEIVAISSDADASASSTWLLTDTALNIISVQDSNVFDLNTGTPGTCLIWQVVHDSTLMGASVDANAGDLSGCFALSNSITISKVSGADCGGMMDTCMVSGGIISSTDELVICVGDSMSNSINVTLDSAVGTLMSWIITDSSLNITDIPLAPPFELDDKGEGVCLIWHISYEPGLMGAAIGANAADLSGCFNLSNPITVIKQTGLDCPGACVADGGQILVQDSLTELTVCIDDSTSIVNVSLDGGSGTNSAWVITDTSLNILSIDSSNVFDFSNSGTGECLVWHVSFEDNAQGVEVGANAADLAGCLSLSNSVKIIKVGGEDCPGFMATCDVMGSTIALEDSTQTSICVDDDAVELITVLSDVDSGTMTTWLVTDTALTILLVNENNIFDIEGAGVGTCLIWQVTHDSTFTGAAEGNMASDLAGCFELSNSIRVERLDGCGEPINVCDLVGSTIALEDSTQTSICIDDDVLELITVLSDVDSGAMTTWLVTDTALTILLVNDSNVFDIEGAGAGTCLIWQVTHDSTFTGATVDSSAAGLAGCFALSNSVTVERLAGDDCPQPECGLGGASLTLLDSTTTINVCAGDGLSDAFNVILQNEGEGNKAWIITDEDGNILAFPLSPPFDFDGAGAGTALLYHLTFENGISGASLGGNVENLEGCFGLSNPITVIREQVNGGAISLPGDGGDEVVICDDGSGFTPFDVLLENADGQNSQWVITDTEGVIINFPLAPPFDLEGTGSGTSLLWHLSFQDGLEGLEVGNDANAVQGCFEYSNPITISYNQVDGGTLTADGGEEVLVCLDDAEGDIVTLAAEGNVGDNMAYVVTDEDGVILEIADGPEIDFGETEAGVCLVWLLSFNGEIEGAVVDSNANDLVGCFDLSNPVTITRVTGDDCPAPCLANGGIATIQDGPSDIVICADDGLSDLFEVTIDSASATNMALIITDDQGVVIGIQTSNNVDLEGSGAGTSNIYNIAYEEGVTLPSIGGNISDISGCFALSNPIVVTRLGGEDCPFVCEIERGTIETSNGTTEETFCTDDGEDDLVDVVQEGATGEDNFYLITDADANIIEIAMGGQFNFEGAESGTSLIWHLTSTGSLSGMNIGSNAGDLTGCFELSNAITINTITGDECLPPCTTDGGDVMYIDNTNEGEYCSGDVRFTITHTSEADPELDYFYIVTDEADNILEVRNSADGGDFDFSRMANSVSHVWGWSTDGTIIPEIGDPIAALEEGCNVLSGDFVNVTITSGGQCDVGCHPPRDVRITPAGGNRYKVRWDRVNEADSYIVEVGFQGIPSSFAMVPVSRRKVTLTVPEGRIVVIRVKAICPGGEMSEFTIDFIIDNTSKSKRPKAGDQIEVSEIDIQEDGHVYPNPAIDRLQVWYEGNGLDGRLSIISQDGRQVMTGTLPGDLEFHTIDINDLSRGLYMLMVHTDGEITVNERFVKAE